MRARLAEQANQFVFPTSAVLCVLGGSKLPHQYVCSHMGRLAHLFSFCILDITNALWQLSTITAAFLICVSAQVLLFKIVYPLFPAIMKPSLEIFFFCLNTPALVVHFVMNAWTVLIPVLSNFASFLLMNGSSVSWCSILVSNERKFPRTLSLYVVYISLYLYKIAFILNKAVDNSDLQWLCATTRSLRVPLLYIMPRTSRW